MPDAFYRLLAFPNGIAMIGLGFSLWHTTRATTPAQPSVTSMPAPRAPSARDSKVTSATTHNRPATT
jgi:hypothetical protein